MQLAERPKALPSSPGAAPGAEDPLGDLFHNYAVQRERPWRSHRQRGGYENRCAPVLCPSGADATTCLGSGSVDPRAQFLNDEPQGPTGSNAMHSHASSHVSAQERHVSAQKSRGPLPSVPHITCSAVGPAAPAVVSRGERGGHTPVLSLAPGSFVPDGCVPPAAHAMVREGAASAQWSELSAEHQRCTAEGSISFPAMDPMKTVPLWDAGAHLSLASSSCWSPEDGTPGTEAEGTDACSERPGDLQEEEVFGRPLQSAALERSPEPTCPGSFQGNKLDKMVLPQAGLGPPRRSNEFFVDLEMRSLESKLELISIQRKLSAVRSEAFLAELEAYSAVSSPGGSSGLDGFWRKQSLDSGGARARRARYQRRRALSTMSSSKQSLGLNPATGSPMNVAPVKSLSAVFIPGVTKAVDLSQTAHCAVSRTIRQNGLSRTSRMSSFSAGSIPLCKDYGCPAPKAFLLPSTSIPTSKVQLL